MFKRLRVYTGIENKVKGNYKIFSIIPAVSITIDHQFKKDLNINHKGWREYSLFFDFFAWSSYVTLEIKNK